MVEKYCHKLGETLCEKYTISAIKNFGKLNLNL